MSIMPSKAHSTEIWKYTDGACHVFAVTLHRMTGWSMLLVLDENNPYWVDAVDKEKQIASTVHAFCVDENLGLWDVRGFREPSELQHEIAYWYATPNYTVLQILNEDELQEFITPSEHDAGEEDCYPLASYDETDVTEACDVIKRAFGGMITFKPYADAPSSDIIL